MKSRNNSLTSTVKKSSKNMKKSQKFISQYKFSMTDFFKCKKPCTKGVKDQNNTIPEKKSLKAVFSRYGINLSDEDFSQNINVNGIFNPVSHNNITPPSDKESLVAKNDNIDIGEDALILLKELEMNGDSLLANSQSVFNHTHSQTITSFEKGIERMNNETNKLFPQLEVPSKSCFTGIEEVSSNSQDSLTDIQKLLEENIELYKNFAQTKLDQLYFLEKDCPEQDINTVTNSRINNLKNDFSFDNDDSYTLFNSQDILKKKCQTSNANDSKKRNLIENECNNSVKRLFANSILDKNNDGDKSKSFINIDESVKDVRSFNNIFNMSSSARNNFLPSCVSTGNQNLRSKKFDLKNVISEFDESERENNLIERYQINLKSSKLSNSSSNKSSSLKFFTGNSLIHTKNDEILTNGEEKLAKKNNTFGEALFKNYDSDNFVCAASNSRNPIGKDKSVSQVNKNTSLSGTGLLQFSTTLSNIFHDNKFTKIDTIRSDKDRICSRKNSKTMESMPRLRNIDSFSIFSRTSNSNMFKSPYLIDDKTDSFNHSSKKIELPQINLSGLNVTESSYIPAESQISTADKRLFCRKNEYRNVFSHHSQERYQIKVLNQNSLNHPNSQISSGGLQFGSDDTPDNPHKNTKSVEDDKVKLTQNKEMPNLQRINLFPSSSDIHYLKVDSFNSFGSQNSSKKIQIAPTDFPNSQNVIEPSPFLTKTQIPTTEEEMFPSQNYKILPQHNPHRYQRKSLNQNSSNSKILSNTSCSRGFGFDDTPPNILLKKIKSTKNDKVKLSQNKEKNKTKQSTSHFQSMIALSNSSQISNSDIVNSQNLDVDQIDSFNSFNIINSQQEQTYFPSPNIIESSQIPSSQRTILSTDNQRSQNNYVSTQNSQERCPTKLLDQNNESFSCGNSLIIPNSFPENFGLSHSITVNEEIDKGKSNNSYNSPDFIGGNLSFETFLNSSQLLSQTPGSKALINKEIVHNSIPNQSNSNIRLQKCQQNDPTSLSNNNNVTNTLTDIVEDHILKKRCSTYRTEEEYLKEFMEDKLQDIKKYLYRNQINKDKTGTDYTEMILQTLCNPSTAENDLEDLFNQSLCCPPLRSSQIEIISSQRNSCSNQSMSSQDLRNKIDMVCNNESLISKESVHTDLSDDIKKVFILQKISDVFTKLLQQIQDGDEPILRIRSQKKWHNCMFVNNRLLLKPVGRAKTTDIRSKSKFNLIIFLLGKIVTLLINNSFCTKRELYYQLIKFVKSQGQINIAVDTITCLLDEPPWDLRVLATNKGLVYGDLTITLSEDEVIKCNITGGSLIPQNQNKITKLQSDASFILIVEKDCIFQKLLDEDLLNKLPRSCIMITGKGFSDVNTRLFIRKLWQTLSIPVFVFVDADPYGIDIMLNYRFGSLALAHLSEHLALPNLRWMGIHPSEMLLLNIVRQPLTIRDKRRIEEMLKRPYIHSVPQIRQELQLMLKENFKAEIEGLMKSENYLRNYYIPSKFYSQTFL